MTRAGWLHVRPGPLRTAAWLAAFFVAARVVYRILFHGVDGDGLVLLPLPAFRLPAPFSWVTLLGPVTLDGLWGAVLSALPIAGVILLFGVLNALFDVSRAFGMLARRGPLRGIARALAVAWSTLPSLGQAVRTVHTAQRLRGEKAGPRMLVPVLERSLERAAAVANGLELRGFGGTPVEGDCRYPVTVSHVALGFDDRRVLGLTRFTLQGGRLVLVTGATGSGKSTLLRALAGLHDHVDDGWSAGALVVAGRHRRETPPRDTSRLIGVVLQNPREGFCSERVSDEVGIALQLRGVASAIVADRVGEVAARLGLTDLLDRSVSTLSAGEATLVAIAAAVVERPILLLIDEPLADLDAAARVRVVDALDALAHEGGVCVLVAEHRAEAFAPVADQWWRIDDGEVRIAEGSPEQRGASLADALPGATVADASRAEPPQADVSQPGTPRAAVPQSDVPAAFPGGPLALAASQVRVVHHDTVAVHDATVALAAGDVVALIGPNGAGKSSLLTALALPPRGLAVTGSPMLVPDASDDLFTCDTVSAECRRADRVAHRAGIRSATSTAQRFAALLGLDSAAVYLDRHPRDLSLGERRCLAIALQLSRAPQALLIDEPTRGLDAHAREQVRGALQQAADAGTAVLMATHDADFAQSLGARIIPMHDGVAPASAPAAEPVPAPKRLPAADVAPPAVLPSAVTTTAARRAPQWAAPALLLANLVALAAFTWPLAATALPAQVDAAAPWVALALAPIAVVVAVAALDESVRSAHLLAYLGVLAAIGSALRIASTGVGGVEALFIVLILAGRAFGARFGMLLGVATILLSSTVFGGFGPWTPFQMFACGWVGAVAGLLPRRVRGWGEIVMLCAYGAAASYVFGLLLNLWFWPFAVGPDTAISYQPGAPISQNLGSFLLYSLVTSTVGWDTLRAITTIVGIVIVGRPVLAALRRAKPVAPARRDPAFPPRPRRSDVARAGSRR